MGMAGLKGMLRRTLYDGGEFDIYMILAMFCGILLLIGFLAFFINVAMSVGLKGLLQVFFPSKLDTKEVLAD